MILNDMVIAMVKDACLTARNEDGTLTGDFTLDTLLEWLSEPAEYVPHGIFELRTKPRYSVEDLILALIERIEDQK